MSKYFKGEDIYALGNKYAEEETRKLLKLDNKKKKISLQKRLEGMIKNIGTPNAVSKEIIIERFRKYSLDYGVNNWFREQYNLADKKYQEQKE